ncbi:DNA-binding IclR family transcriptional regulator [Variovorax boronicumulans]|uniref:DNA-binding IclR family transcriptional regulator n=1 Tax=Variovorax boronicumulans TaxID=436515 RepID=A0AAW8DUX2_9BURK|nr:IclR family transcriptional regulator [Variovorax boronicumulans]MDP9878005.1 DNA-binding IclR family transcriptional regulator [Variovorax boronicumulans]MDP9923288.1 DNA-binding IclR family transcriptional regulator [Variovorax boronicumulans]
MTEISKTADQALVLLAYVAEHGPLGTTDLARRLKMHRTVVHRLLATLQGRGFVHRVDAGYLPGTALLHLAQFVEPELIGVSRPTLHALAQEYGETFILTALQGSHEAIQIEQAVGGHHFMRVQLTRGFRHPLSKGASGRSILAFCDDEVIAHFLEKAEDPVLLAEQLEAVRREGFAVSHDELSAGVHGVSVPILVDRKPVASIGVVYPAVREEAATTYARALKKAATTIARAVRRNPPA